MIQRMELKMNNQIPLNHVHQWVCPTGGEFVICVCKICGETKTHRNYIPYDREVPLILKSHRIKRPPDNKIDGILEHDRHLQRLFRY